MQQNNSIHADPWLKRCMKLGIPLAILCVASLWLGQVLGSPALGWVFLLTLPPVLLLGLTYNLRFLLLWQRSRRQSSR
ncbi:hypothetical protein H9C73_00400 [Marinobacterium sp. AK62]|uniref:Uncharacterized protein n=1 Tax=Marinobacterium alkalitolerans TaxID=1542925 RepID=A0ABS3Z645_9GAMM|nr:hypothetical protein [Marinobacterium alkalitolerans]MBP0047179.1 hypothetical protein [Marinobacterium alkalitolerans]